MGFFDLFCCLLLLSGLGESRSLKGYLMTKWMDRSGSIFGSLQQSGATSELAGLLSRSSSIFGPDDSRWREATNRYSDYAVTHPSLIVQPGAESDIEKIIQFANRNNLDFFVVNRAHSLTTSVEAFSGIQIDVTKLRGIKILTEKSTVRLEGGAFNHEVIAALWDQGYVTTTGACSCVGMAGPALGGGHGHLQGHHGLISDNLVSMRLALANGTAITVDGNTNVDLWWALRGAGHNFGIVTSFEMRIHPREGLERWYCRTYTFSHDKLEALFEELIRFQEDSLPNTIVTGHFGGYAMDTTISTTEAIISWTFVFSGSQDDADSILSPFDRLEPISTFDQSTMYPSLPDALGSGLDSELCAASKAHIVSTTGLTRFNVTSQRQIYELYTKSVARHPALRNARVLHEGYSTEAVRRVPAESSAYAFRDERLLMYFDAILEPGQEDLEEFTKQWARETRKLWNEGQPERPSTTYVNYAFGDESVESMYGYEPWRLEKLRALKAQYDPHNKFRYYNPIIPMSSFDPKDEL